MVFCGVLGAECEVHIRPGVARKQKTNSTVSHFRPRGGRVTPSLGESNRWSFDSILLPYKACHHLMQL
jgi:hypothetical protein